MSSDGQKDGDESSIDNIDDGWGLEESWDSIAPAPGSDSDTDPEPEAESETEAESDPEPESLISRAAADTNAALARARAALDESRAAAGLGSAASDDEDAADDDDADESETAPEVEPRTDEVDDSAVTAFRAKIETLQRRVDSASDESRRARRGSLLIGLAGGLIVGTGIGWFASQSTMKGPVASSEPTMASATPAPAEPAAQAPSAPEPAPTELPPPPETSRAVAAAPVQPPEVDAAPVDAATAPDAAPVDSSEGADEPIAPAPDAAVEQPREEPPPSASAEGPGVAVPSPREGVVTKIFAKPGQRVWKGERLFEVSRQTSPAEEAAVQEARIAALEAVQARTAEQEAELAEAKRLVELYKKGFRGNRKSVAYAPAGGFFEHQLEKGQVVEVGEVLGKLRELDK